nr:MMPL family transporter [Azospirillum sp. B510]
MQSGNWLERLIFNHRLLILLVIAIVSSVLGLQASRMTVNASFERMIPQSQPWIQNYLQNKEALRGLGNAVRIVIETRDGTVLDSHYLDILRRINDAVYLMPGVDRSWMRSLWMPIVRWTEVTEEGFRGGPVMPDRFDGSPEKIEELRRNIQRANIVGSLIGRDLKSSMILVPLLDSTDTAGTNFNYRDFNDRLDAIFAANQDDRIQIHVVGFARLMGDLIAGLGQVITYFAFSVAVATLFVFFYTRCLRSTILLVVASLLGVVWMLGLMRVFGFELDPYSTLGPFLIFAIGLSHGAQKMNGIMQDIARGTDKYVAARYTFRRLFAAGLAALLVNIVGFAVLFIIDIPVIHDLALSTSLGVSVLVFTKLVLIPVLLSYTGVSRTAAQRSLRKADGQKQVADTLWGTLVRFTQLPWASTAVAATALVTGISLEARTHIQVGDLDAGAPELRTNSRYNQDIAYVNGHYELSSDQFSVIVKTPRDQCETFETLTETLRLSERLREVPGVVTVRSAPEAIQFINAGLYEGNPKWIALLRNPNVTSNARNQLVVNQPDLVNTECAIMPVIAYLADHKSVTLQRMTAAATEFAAQHNTPDRQFLLAAGTAGIEAATNDVVQRAFWNIHFLLYGAVIVLCFMTFRSWRAVLVALVPLVITSFLCEALMVWLGIGIKVATLPVIALGVGVGVDYALYLLSIQLVFQRQGASLSDAYRESLGFTGKVVALIGLTMAAGVIPWAWSPIKFQADMGILLTFMFLWNMIGALVLIPALSYFLLPSKRPAGAAIHRDGQHAATLRGSNP